MRHAKSSLGSQQGRVGGIGRKKTFFTGFKAAAAARAAQAQVQKSTIDSPAWNHPNASPSAAWAAEQTHEITSYSTVSPATSAASGPGDPPSDLTLFYESSNIFLYHRPLRQYDFSKKGVYLAGGVSILRIYINALV